jgi:signal transduction histidine kinase
VWPIVEEVCSAFRGYVRAKKVDITNTVPKDLTTRPMLECELRSILLNLLTNALKALLMADGHEVRFSATREATGVTIEVCDTGEGANPDKWEWYFEPFNSESPIHKELGAGTGLGLTIARDLARSYGGDIKFTRPTPPWKTCVRVELPNA